MKTSAIVRIVLFTLAILILGSILLGVLLIGQLATNLKESKLLENFHISDFVEDVIDMSNEDVFVVSGEGKSAVFDPNEFDALEIEWAAGSISIQPGNTDVITITEDAVSNPKYEMQFSNSGNTIKIEGFEDDTIHFGITSFKVVSKDLVITVPQDWYCKKLEVDAAAADLTINNMRIDTIDFDSASGELRLNNCHVDKIDLDTASGDVEFSGTLNVLECDAASASCTIEVFNIPSRIEMQSASGNLELHLPEDCGFTCQMETLSGHFNSDFSTSSSNGQYVYGNGACRIDLEAMSGNIFIRKADATAPCTEPDCTEAGHGHSDGNF